MKKRYLSDYTLEEQVDPRTGKSRSVPKYRGRTYRFVLQGEKLRRTKLLFAGLTGGSVLALLAAFLTNAPVGHRWYVMMPLALMLLPLFLQGESCVLLLRAGENVKRSERAFFLFFPLQGIWFLWYYIKKQYRMLFIWRQQR